MKTRTLIAGAASVTGLVLVALVVGRWSSERAVDPAVETSPAVTPATPSIPAAAEKEPHPAALYGRVTTVDGDAYEGRLRFGGDEEAFWGHYFNGFKDENPWAAHVAPERLPRERRRLFEIFGVEISLGHRPADLGRPFMVRFGDVARIEALGRDLRVTLKSGTVFELDRFNADDFADGVRVWDGGRGVVDLEEWRIRTIELLPAGRLTTGSTPGSGAACQRLHGTVRTRQGDFTGFLQWDREECVGSDALDGLTADGALSLRFDTIRSIARRSPDSSVVTLLDGREIALSGTPEVGHGNRGVFVDDPRYGRVLVSWDAFERVDFEPGGHSPGYGDFPPGRPLTGSVTTRAGRRLTGRLVYDLDESETTETLDAPLRGVSYTIPFDLVASIALSDREDDREDGREERGARRARVTLHGGEELELERSGDLGEGNAGLLIFVDGRERPEYVPWMEVDQVDLHPLPAMDPPLGGG